MEHVYCLIAFDSAFGAVQAHKVLEEAGMSAHIMPTPREVTASCGLSLRLPPEDYRSVREVLDSVPDCRKGCRYYRMSYDPNSRSIRPMED